MAESMRESAALLIIPDTQKRNADSGQMHKEYLRREKPALYASLLLSERLYPLCRGIDEAAADRLAKIADRETAHEIILSELVYV